MDCLPFLPPHYTRRGRPCKTIPPESCYSGQIPWHYTRTTAGSKPRRNANPSSTTRGGRSRTVEDELESKRQGESGGGGERRKRPMRKAIPIVVFLIALPASVFLGIVLVLGHGGYFPY